MMSKKTSFIGRGDIPPDELDTARKCVTVASEDRQSDRVTILRKALIVYPDIAASFVWLHVHESRHADDTAMLMLAVLLKDPAFTPVQRRRSVQAAITESEKFLRDKSLADSVKFTLLPILVMADQPFDFATVGRFFRNYAMAAQGYQLDFSESLSDSPAQFTKLLHLDGFLSEGGGTASTYPSLEKSDKLLSLASMVEENSAIGAMLMTAALIYRAGAPDFAPERAWEQLDAIHALGIPRARWCLEVLANWPGFAMPFRSKAARLAAELEDRGVNREAPPVPGRFSHSIVSMIDGSGSRSAALFHRTMDDGLDAFIVMLNDAVGAKDVQLFFNDGDELEEMLRLNPEQVSMANAPLSVFRELLEDSFALHEQLGTAPPGSLFPLLAYLGDEPITPRRREPNLDAYKLKTIRPTSELVAGGEELAGDMVFGCLYPASDEAYAFCEAHWDRQNRFIKSTDFAEFLLEIMPLERERLLRRMAINLEVEALAGRAGHEDNQMAAKLWFGMMENVEPLWTIPYVHELARNGVSVILDDLRQGFRNQREAFAASEMGTSLPEDDFGCR